MPIANSDKERAPLAGPGHPTAPGGTGQNLMIF